MIFIHWNNARFKKRGLFFQSPNSLFLIPYSPTPEFRQLFTPKPWAYLASGKTRSTFSNSGKNAHSRNLVWGYTMVEIVVMLSIVTAISGMVLVNFGGLNEGASLNRSARELALAIRKAQNMSISVTQVPITVPDAPQVPLAIGIKFSTANPQTHFLFGELFLCAGSIDHEDPNCPGGTYVLDYKYTYATDGSEVIVDEKIKNSDEFFDRNIKISHLIGEDNIEYPVIHIVFAAPEADMVITDAAGTPITGEQIEIKLLAPSTQKTKTVLIRTTGQISIK